MASIAAALLAAPAFSQPRRPERLPPGVGPSVERAALKLRSGACAALLDDFHDGAGRPLSRNLEALGLPAHEFLGGLRFVPGGNYRPCLASSTAAFTSPGHHVVYVCEKRFLTLANADPEEAAHTLIHEALHALGLGENPPSSREITDAVARRCGGEARPAPLTQGLRADSGQ